MEPGTSDNYKRIESTIFETLKGKSSIVSDVMQLGKKPSEKDSHPVEPAEPYIYDERQWVNWSQNLACKPKYTCFPKNLDQLIDCVTKAVKEGLHIRCAAEGHSWSTLSMTNGFLIVFNENLSKIIEIKQENGDWVVRAEAGARISKIDEHLRRHDPPLTIESMTVLDSVRIGGVVATGSHGAKTEASTIAEQVTSLEIVDAKGNLNVFSDDKCPDEMAAARVNLGLLGVIYSVTLRVKPMYNLLMTDSFPKLNEITKEVLEQLVKDPKTDGVEIFYWPFNASPFSTDPSEDKLWIKRWEKSTQSPKLNRLEIYLYHLAQKATTSIADNLYKSLRDYPRLAPLISYLSGLISMRDYGECEFHNMVWEAPDAIHYQAGIDNILCQDMEFAMKADDDFDNVITELNYIVNLIYKYQKDEKFPLNVTVEMRILKRSKALLSAAYDNNDEAYYFFLEVLSVNDTQYFNDFCIEIANRWMGKQGYNARPHWAKSWEFIPEIDKYLGNLSRENIIKFEAIRVKYDPHNIFFDNNSLRSVFDEALR